MQKGFLDTALRVTAMAAMIVVILCVASFGLSQFRQPGKLITDSSTLPVGQDPISQIRAGQIPGTTTGSGMQPRPAGPDPLGEHLDRLGKRLEELASTVSRERSTQAEIASLADSMQASRQQADLSDTKLQQELGSLRVNNEVELRDLNRQISHVSEKSHHLEREMIEQRAGILSALENQRTTIESQVARLEGGLNDVHSELTDLRNYSRSTLTSVPSANTQSFRSQNSLSPVPLEPPRNADETTANTSTWKEPVNLDSTVGVQSSVSTTTSPTRTATSTGWKVSPMSHSVPGRRPQLPVETSPLSLPLPLPLAPPATELKPATRPPVLDTSRRANSGPIRAPLKSTLAPPSVARPQRVPEIVELSHAAEAPLERAVIQASQNDRRSNRVFDIQTTVIHVAASRPVDIEPAGVRMLNPELSTTAYGLPWTHDAVTHELLRKISLRTEASVAGRQNDTINSDGMKNFSIGSSCPHCNEVHGFEAGDHLIIEAGSASDRIQRFHVTSKVVGSDEQLNSIPDFDLTPMAGQTYVVSEEAVEGTVEESVATSEDKLVPIHGVLTPVSGPLKTRVATRIMQRLVVMTFRERNTSQPTTDAINVVAAGDTVKKIMPPAPLTLPATEPSRQIAIKQLTPVKQPPVFLPPPAPASALKARDSDSDVEFVNANSSPNAFPKIQHTKHQAADKPCEICQQKHDSTKTEAEEPAARTQSNSLANWFRRVRGESTDPEREVTTADFQIDEPESEKPKTETTSDNQQRRYVVKPGNRRSVR